MSEPQDSRSKVSFRMYAVLAVLVAVLVMATALAWYLARTGIRQISAKGAWLTYRVPAWVFWVDDEYSLEPALWQTDRCVVAVNQANFFGSAFTDEDAEALRRFRMLEGLDVAGASFTPRGFRALHSLPQLKILMLRDTAVDAADLEGFSSLHTLVLDGVPLTEASITTATTRPQLTTLTLTNTNFTDADVAALANCPQLDSLNLGGTRITDAGVIQIAVNCSQLTQLGLEETGVTDACLRVAEELPRLDVLDLRGTMVTDEEVTRRIAADPSFPEVIVVGAD